MGTEMTVESLLELIEQSRVIDEDQIRQLADEFLSRHAEFDSAEKVADELVSRDALTRWQVEQLLQGKHRGFFLGSYRILDLLGSGGMGRVYLAEHQMMHRRCAIKVLPPKQSKRQASTVARFYREAQAVAALDHPNIVQAYDVNKTQIDETEVHYLVMEYVDGQDFQKVVREQGVLDFRQAADFIRQAAKGLAHAHQRGLIHRDIKPANLILDLQGVVKILDLGLARCFDDDGEAAAAIASEEGVAGTADYLSPEQAVASKDIDSRTDIYSLGQTFYFLLTGHPPFPDGTVAQRLSAHRKKSPEAITKTRPDAPLSLLAIFERMTAKSPDRRYRSADDVVEALDEWLGDDDKGALRMSTSRLAKSLMPASDVPLRTSDAAEDEVDLELAPLEDQAEAGDSIAKGVEDKSAEDKSAEDKSAEDRADTNQPASNDRLAVPEDDLSSAMDDVDLMSESAPVGPAVAPLGTQGSQGLRRPGRKPTAVRIVESPQFWILVAGLAIVGLVVVVVAVLPTGKDAPTRPSPSVDKEPRTVQQRSRPAPPPPPGPQVPPAPPKDDTPAPPKDDTPEPPKEKTPEPPKEGTDVVAKDGTLVPVGSTWRWLHPTDGVDPATDDSDFHATFHTLAYDDSHWREDQDSAGKEGGFGYGDPAQVPFDTPAEEHRKTAYFRHAFRTDTVMKDLVLSLQFDDGVVIYLDGKEVGRENIGDGPEAYDLFANGGDDAVVDEKETEVRQIELPGTLSAGEHVLAISLHNWSGESSDLRIAEISLQGVAVE